LGVEDKEVIMEQEWRPSRDPLQPKKKRNYAPEEKEKEEVLNKISGGVGRGNALLQKGTLNRLKKTRPLKGLVSA